jgi:hypothetical protein
MVTVLPPEPPDHGQAASDAAKQELAKSRVIQNLFTCKFYRTQQRRSIPVMA